MDIVRLADGGEWGRLELVMVSLGVVGVMVLVIVIGGLDKAETTVASAVASAAGTAGCGRSRSRSSSRSTATVATAFRAGALAAEPELVPGGIGIDELIGDVVAAGKSAGLAEIAVVEDDPLTLLGRCVSQSLRQFLFLDHLPQSLDRPRVLLRLENKREQCNFCQ